MKKQLEIPTWMKIIIHINEDNRENKNVTTISKEQPEKITIGYGQVLSISEWLVSNNLVTKTKQGRRMIIKITTKGKRIAELCKQLTEELK